MSRRSPARAERFVARELCHLLPEPITPTDLASAACDRRAVYGASARIIAEAQFSLYEDELIRGPEQGPWRTIDEVELATLLWVTWFNTRRLHGALADIPPGEYEETHYAQLTATG